LALFLFGTLMDPDVQEGVLGRAVAPEELEPATLPGWRRVRALQAGYPLILPDPVGRVEGLLFPRPSRRDRLRILHFESEEYAPFPVTVLRADGGTQAAEAFVALDGMLATDGEAWHLAAWAVEHKALFLTRCDAWMADCPAPEVT
jgi:hypothetical protein